MRVVLLLSSGLVLASAKDVSSSPLKRKVGTGRIIGGETAEDGEFPWQVSIRYSGSLGITHFCGGSIIDKDWILTSAWCCDYSNELPFITHVVAGGIELLTFEEEEQTRNVRQIIRHPNYNFTNNMAKDDICLLHLSESLVWTDWVKPLALPEQSQEIDVGTVCTLTGWGTTNNEVEYPANKLHKVDVPVTSNAECNATYADLPYLTINDSMFCAGLPEGDKGACNGDNGSPIICGADGSKQNMGIMSRVVYGCADPGYPDIYTKTSFYVDWIMETMASFA